MHNLYIAVIKITASEISLLTNQEIDAAQIYKFDGFEYSLISADTDFYHLSVYAFNPYTTIILGATLENSGHSIGSQYDSPVMVKTDGGFAGILCTYVFEVSRFPINIDTMLHSLRINLRSNITVENYRELEERCEIAGRISAFAEMMNFINSNVSMTQTTADMIANTKVYRESFFSNRNPAKNTAVVFEENSTLSAIKGAAGHGKRLAVLSFANPIEPGGGILRGVDGQEQSICRLSNLYKSLSSDNAAEFYQTNKKIRAKNQFNSMFLGTDSIVYSPGVTVFEKNNNYGTAWSKADDEPYDKQRIQVDVITCSAPFFSDSGYILPDGDLQHLFERRIRNIFEVAIDNDIDILVLGAFGCGAFHNPVDIVANAFREVLLEPSYRKAFERVIFAIKRTDVICPNIEAFGRCFSCFPELNLNN